MPQAKKLKMLRERDQEQRKQQREQIERWLGEFDANGDGKLQREELRALLTALNPSRPPSDENLDYLIEKATAVESSSLRLKGDKNGAVTNHQIRPTVLRYGQYCKDEAYLDSVFERFDHDGNGELDDAELFYLLEEVAPEGCTVEEADVRFVLDTCDANGDGVITRDEVLPLVSTWTQVGGRLRPRACCPVRHRLSPARVLSCRTLAPCQNSRCCRRGMHRAARTGTTSCVGVCVCPPPPLHLHPPSLSSPNHKPPTSNHKPPTSQLAASLRPTAT